MVEAAGVWVGPRGRIRGQWHVVGRIHGGPMVGSKYPVIGGGEELALARWEHRGEARSWRKWMETGAVLAGVVVAEARS